MTMAVFLSGSKLVLWLKRKIATPLLRFIRMGVSPRELAIAVSLGIILGIIPVLGVTTILCSIPVFLFRLNMAAIQIANWVVYPFQLLFYIPFIHFGQKLFGRDLLPFSVSEIIQMVRADFWDAFGRFWLAHLMGVCVWLLASIPLYFLSFYFFRFVFRRLTKKYA